MDKQLRLGVRYHGGWRARLWDGMGRFPILGFPGPKDDGFGIRNGNLESGIPLRLRQVGVRLIHLVILISACVALGPPARGGGDPPGSDSPLVKLLRSGRVPEARQGTIIEMIGKRGNAADLEYIYQQALTGSVPPPIRVKALDALAEAAL